MLKFILDVLIKKKQIIHPDFSICEKVKWVLGYEKELACKIKVFSTASEIVFWFKVSRDISNLDQDVIFGIVYVPPEKPGIHQSF